MFTKFLKITACSCLVVGAMTVSALTATSKTTSTSTSTTSTSSIQTSKTTTIGPVVGPTSATESVTLTPSSTQVLSGANITLSWSALPSTSVVCDPDWSTTNYGASGTLSAKVTTSRTFTISCKFPSGITKTASKTVSVLNVSTNPNVSSSTSAVTTKTPTTTGSTIVPAGPFTVNALSATNVSGTSVTMNGQVVGGFTANNIEGVQFFWSSGTTAPSQSSVPVTGVIVSGSTDKFAAAIPGNLTAGTKYNYIACAVNDNNIKVCSSTPQTIITTSNTLSNYTVTTNNASGVTSTTGEMNATVSATGFSDFKFYYGAGDSTVISTTSSSVSGIASTNGLTFKAAYPGTLTSGAEYSYKACAKTPAGNKICGDVKSFTALASNSGGSTGGGNNTINSSNSDLNVSVVAATDTTVTVIVDGTSTNYVPSPYSYVVGIKNASTGSVDAAYTAATNITTYGPFAYSYTFTGLQASTSYYAGLCLIGAQLPNDCTVPGTLFTTAAAPVGGGGGGGSSSGGGGGGGGGGSSSGGGGLYQAAIVSKPKLASQKKLKAKLQTTLNTSCPSTVYYEYGTTKFNKKTKKLIIPSASYNAVITGTTAKLKKGKTHKVRLVVIDCTNVAKTGPTLKFKAK